MTYAQSAQDRTRVAARLKSRNAEGEYHKAEIVEMGPLGAQLTRSNQGGGLSLGERVDLELAVEGERTEFGGVVANLKVLDDVTQQINVRFLSERDTEPDRRAAARWICPTTFLPTAVAPAPGQFNDFISFQIRNISRNGLELQTDLENRFLLKGMLLRLSISLPLTGDLTVVSKIVRMSVGASGGTEILSVGVEIVDADFQARELLTQYLLQFSNINSFEEMRENRYARSGALAGVTFRFLRSEADYESLRKLKSATREGRNDPEGLKRIKDLFGRVAIAKRNGDVIASVTVMFPDYKQTFNSGIRGWPESLPRKDQIVEVSDMISVNPTSDVVLMSGLLSFVYSTCISGQRPYALCHAERHYHALLQKLGMSVVEGGEIEHQVFLGHPIDSVTGTGANPFLWNFVWSSAARYLIASKTSVPKGVTRIMLKVYRAFNIFLPTYLKLIRLGSRAL